MWAVLLARYPVAPVSGDLVGGLRPAWPGCKSHASARMAGDRSGVRADAQRTVRRRSAPRPSRCRSLEYDHPDAAEVPTAESDLGRVGEIEGPPGDVGAAVDDGDGES